MFQFRTDVKVNAFDVEEIVWDIASQLRLDASRFPPSNMMSLPEGRKDPRKIMVIDTIVCGWKGAVHTIAVFLNFSKSYRPSSILYSGANARN